MLTDISYLHQFHWYDNHTAAASLTSPRQHTPERQGPKNLKSSNVGRPLSSVAYPPPRQVE